MRQIAAHDAIALLGHPRQLVDRVDRVDSQTEPHDIQRLGNGAYQFEMGVKLCTGFKDRAQRCSRKLQLSAGFERDARAIALQRDEFSVLEDGFPARAIDDALQQDADPAIAPVFDRASVGSVEANFFVLSPHQPALRRLFASAEKRDEIVAVEIGLNKRDERAEHAVARVFGAGQHAVAQPTDISCAQRRRFRRGVTAVGFPEAIEDRANRFAIAHRWIRALGWVSECRRKTDRSPLAIGDGHAADIQMHALALRATRRKRYESVLDSDTQITGGLAHGSGGAVARTANDFFETDGLLGNTTRDRDALDLGVGRVGADCTANRGQLWFVDRTDPHPPDAYQRLLPQEVRHRVGASSTRIRRGNT